MIHVLVTADLNCPRKADRIKKEGKVFHPFRALIKEECVTRVGRTMYSGILTLILLFTILYMVVSRAILCRPPF